ncbi:MAG TPA: 4-phosphopantoate--beta-alanine ligase [Phycisphaerales bacterium]|nr:4-phosphopantoate--beta-alanine ligase [Phycisphaerales bacterium]
MWICRGDEPLGDRAGGVVLVPTMGALHEGHLALVRLGVAHAERSGLRGCVVSVFVNPTQFDDPADYERYARVLDEDAALCEANGAAGVYAPSVEAVYPPDRPVPVPALPDQAVGKGLEDAHRPGHFEGVCQVVRRLFDLVRPAAAVFGEKDWQQLQVVRAMTARDGLGVEILNGPTVREPDGLAMSSRNRFLEGAQRDQALALRRALDAACGESSPARAEAAMRRVFREHGIDEPDYAAVCDAESLGPVVPGRPARAITAARVGTVRLLDNAPWP